MWIRYNPSPIRARVGDCVIRAISKVLDLSWDKVFILIVVKAYQMYDMPSSNAVWGEVLRDHGFTRHVIPDTCPKCYSIQEFCQDNPTGVFVLGTGNHVVAVIDGKYYDSWDSGNEIPIYYWSKE